MSTEGQTINQQNLENKNGNKNICGYLKRQTEYITHEMAWTWLRRRKSKGKQNFFL